MIKKCNNLSEYIGFVDNCHSFRDSTMYNCIYYRGQSDFEYKLIPSLFRRIYGHTEDGENYIPFEKDIVDKARSSFPELFGKYDTTVDLLTQIQHYGLPTRLLDTTDNALVALFFACRSNEKKDGEVIVFGFSRSYTCYDIEPNIIADYGLIISAIKKPKKKDVKDYIEKYGRHSIRDITEIFNSIKEPLAVESRVISERQREQQGNYIIFPHMSDNEFFGESFPAGKKSSMLRDRIIIPAGKKRRILQELSECGITHSRLFPEDKDGACSELLNRITFNAYGI